MWFVRRRRLSLSRARKQAHLCIIPQEIVVRGGKHGEVIGRIDVAGMEQRYGAPYILIHRPILHEILHAHAVKAGARILVNSRVVEYDFDDGKGSRKTNVLLRNVIKVEDIDDPVKIGTTSLA